MASTYSTNLKIELQATGENSGTWGTITNTNLGTALEQAIVGYGNPNYASDANLTLTYTDTNAAQAARALVLNVTSGVSLTGTRELVVPTIQKQYIVQNNTTGSQSITVKTSAGTGITVPNGRKAHLYVDGTNVIYMDDYVDINGGAIDGTPIGANSASTGAFSTLSATGNVGFDGGTFTFNDSGADKDFRVEGDSDANLLFSDASTDRIGIGTNTPATKLDVNGTITATAVNTTTLDLTNLEVTNIKAKDGTAAASIADSTGVVSFTANPILSGGTANGVLYLNASKVATSGTALAFDGTNLSIANTVAAGARLSIADAMFVDVLDAWPSATYDAAAIIARTGSLGSAPFNNAGSLVYRARVNSTAGRSSHIFYTGSPSAERLRIDEVGRLGLNTTPGTGSGLFSLAYTSASLYSTAGAHPGAADAAFCGTYAINTSATTGAFAGNVLYVRNGSSVYQSAGISAVSVAGAGYSPNLNFWAQTGAATFATRMTIDSSGNLGLGVTPSAWTSAFGPVIQVKASTGGGALTGSSADNFRMFANTFYDGAYKRIGAGYATQYEQAAGQHSWYTAGTSTANSSITFTQAMTLDANGNLAIGTTSQYGKLNVFEGTTGGATSPGVLTLGANSQTVASGEVLGRVQFYSNDASTSSAGVVGKIDCIATSTFVADCETALTFHTNDGAAGTIAERARITATGNLLVGTTTDVSGLSGVISDVNGNVRAVPQSGSAKTSSYTLVKGDVGEFINVGSGGSVTVPDSVFATGDIVSVFNNTTGNVTLTMSITTAYIGGTDSDKATITLATRGVATILFISGTVCVVNGNVS